MKKVVCAVIAASMCLSLAACSSAPANLQKVDMHKMIREMGVGLIKESRVTQDIIDAVPAMADAQ